MPLRFLLDENLRGSALWRAIQKHNALGIDVIDLEQVGDPADLPLGTLDPDILVWTERADRIVISLDKSSLPGHLADHLKTGKHSPGIFIIRGGSTLPSIVTFLVLAAHTGGAAAWQDQITYIP